MASLFGKHRLASLASTIKTEDIQGHIELVKAWHHDFHYGSLKGDKETSREQAYNQDFFIKILGYKEKPAIPYSLEPKATTEKGQLPDAVLSYTDTEQDIKNIAAVVELKGASIDLDRPQRREGNMSPVQQGFKYKTQYRNCPFVIVSNFWEFRLYRDNLLDYEAWTLDDLVNPENDYVLFKTWFALTKFDNLTAVSGLSNTEELLTDIRVEQEEIGKKFYKVYREARLELLRDIYRNNPEVKTNIDLGIEKAQKIIDRVVFACFAEDKGLLPDNTLTRVLKAAEGSTFGGSIWNTLKGFFEAVDVGSEKLDIPEGYNGGLFKYDPELNNLKISDEPLRTVLSLGTYNFEQDLSVTILGHIFEQSISDLEEIKNKVNESQNLETIVQGRRKKDGIFYTPDYIVRYIVDNSLGAYLREHEEKCKDEFKLKGEILDKTYEEREHKAYEKYQTYLQNVKVLDPACGSGAFLVYVFDYLMSENKRVASILGSGLFSNDDYIRSILKNNIYGVDLNEESVEITKLSLWLKSAEKGKKLTSLDKNIKCGNSLINDPAVVGNKAFDWNKEFSEIMNAGGFDVVVGNPPYVFTRGGGFEVDTKTFISAYIKNEGIITESKGLNIQKGKINLYAIFLTKGLKLIKPEGYLSYIIPNSILRATPYEAFRKYIVDNYSIQEIVDLGAGIFEGVTVSTVIMTILGSKKENASSLKTKIITDLGNQTDSYFIDQNTFSKNASYIYNILSQSDDSDISVKIAGAETLLGDISKYISPGIDGDKEKYISKEKLNDHYKPILFGKNIGQYLIDYANEYVLYDRALLNRARKEEIFKSPKIVIQRVSGGLTPLKCSLDNESFYTFNSVNNLILKTDCGFSYEYILALLNSRVINWYYSTNFSNKSNLTVNISKTLLEKVPIASCDIEAQKSIADNVTKLNNLYKEVLSKDNKLKSLIHTILPIQSWPTKNNNWWDVSYEDFIKAFHVDFSMKQKDEIFDLFKNFKMEGLLIQENISSIRTEIENTIYDVYKLDLTERKFIEMSLGITK